MASGRGQRPGLKIQDQTTARPTTTRPASATRWTPPREECLVGAATSGEPGALSRGGNFTRGTRVGPLRVYGARWLPVGHEQLPRVPLRTLVVRYWLFGHLQFASLQVGGSCGKLAGCTGGVAQVPHVASSRDACLEESRVTLSRGRMMEGHPYDLGGK
jgi:hypothetical protein